MGDRNRDKTESKNSPALHGLRRLVPKIRTKSLLAYKAVRRVLDLPSDEGGRPTETAPVAVNGLLRNPNGKPEGPLGDSASAKKFVERHAPEIHQSGVDAQAIYTPMRCLIDLHHAGVSIGMADGALLQKYRKSVGLSQAKLGELVGTSQQQIGKLEKGERPITREWARKLAVHLRVTENDLEPVEGGGEVPIVGYVGAGEAIHFYDDHAKGDGLDMIDAPPGVYEGCALKVRGQSMAPRYFDGEIVFYSRTKGYEVRNCLNRDCVIRLNDGRTLLKRVEKGSSPRVFNLRSYNPASPTLVNQEPEWMAPVVWRG